MASTKKYCLFCDLKDDNILIEAYIERHKNVWQEVLDSIKASGIINMEIYNKGNRLFMIIEADASFSFEAKSKNKNLPIIIGEIGSFSKEPKSWSLINKETRKYIKEDKNFALVKTKGLKDKVDKVHFNNFSQREMGIRFAKKYLKLFNK